MTSNHLPLPQVCPIPDSAAQAVPTSFSRIWRRVAAAAIVALSSRIGASQSIPAAVIHEPQAMALMAACYLAMGSPDLYTSVTISGVLKDTDHESAEVRNFTAKIRGRMQERWEEPAAGYDETRIISSGRGHVLRGKKSSALPISETVFRVPELLPGYACKLGIHLTAFPLPSSLQKHSLQPKMEPMAYLRFIEGSPACDRPPLYNAQWWSFRITG